MGEENRGSSGGGTAMIVIAILGGVLVVGCCGGVVTMGLLGILGWRTQDVQMQNQAPNVPPMPVEAAPDFNKALDGLNKDMEPLKIAPEDPTLPALEPGSI